MKYFSLLAVLVLMASLASAQKIDKNTITGQWTVKDVIITATGLSGEEKKMMDVMKKGFMNSTFSFAANGKFTIALQAGAPEVMKGLKFLNNIDWKFKEEEQLIMAGTADDHYNHLRLYVKNDSGKTLFIFNDTPLALEVTRQ